MEMNIACLPGIYGTDPDKTRPHTTSYLQTNLDTTVDEQRHSLLQVGFERWRFIQMD